jgi:hypothetical protein
MVQRLLDARCMSVESAALPEPIHGTEVDRRPKSIILNNPAGGMLWFGGWLFTIGYAQLGFWKAVLGLIIWPYFLGMLAR